MTDVLGLSSHRDSCVVLPTLDHAVHWWERIIDMIDTAEPNILRTKTAIIRRRSGTALRLWVPSERWRQQPMDSDHDFKRRCDYLLLFNLVKELP